MISDKIMANIMRYEIICNESVDGLISEVNKRLKKGWICQGGVGIMTQGEHYKVFYQAMIKESNNG